MQIARIAAACLALVLGSPHRLDAQDPLAVARQLYASAEYEDALRLLDDLAVGDSLREQRQEADLHRALCLVALGRSLDADRVIERMIAQDPLYRPADDIPPRMRTVFRNAKKRALPAIVQQHYGEAKNAFDRQDFAAAAFGFNRVVEALNDPDIADASTLPPLSDLRTLAAGFHDLSVKAMPPPPPPASVAAPPVVPMPPVAPPPITLPPRIHASEDKGVVPPLTIRQDLPTFPLAGRPGGMSGTVEVVINEAGAIESSKMVEPMTATYDRMVLTAASSWRYQPATMNGTPVKFRKRIRIVVSEP